MRSQTDAPSTAPRLRRSRPGALAGGLALLTLLVFLRAVEGDFVDYDDGQYVRANRHVQDGLSWRGVKWAFTTTHASNWHPLTWLSHMLDWHLYGAQPAGHHLTSVALHAANAALLFLALLHLTGVPGRSALVAALFALHPLRVESVAWVSERKDVLSGFFALLALLAYARYARKLATRNATPGQNAALTPTAREVGTAYALALLCYALSLLSKPMGVTLPFVFLLLDYWPLRRLPSAAQGGGSSPAAGAATPWRLVREKLPFFALAAASSVMTFLAQRKGGAVTTLLNLPLTARIENALISYARYLGKAIAPLDLAVLYPHPGRWPRGQVVGAALLLAALSAWVVLWRRRWPAGLVGWCWFMGMLVPVIGLVQVGLQAMADRYTYLPLVGVLVAAVWGLSDLARRWPARGRRLLGGAAGAVLVGWAALTWRQIGYWQNTETLFRRAIAVTKDNYLAHNNLGFFLSHQGRLPEALTHYQAAVRIKPDYEDALNNLGHALAGQGRDAEALPYYEAALRARPGHVEVHNNLGNALANLGRLDEAIVHYQIALRENPDHPGAHNNLGIALAMKGRPADALPHFAAALRARPDDAGTLSNSGNALAALHRFDEAVLHYRRALRLRPDDAQVHNNLGNVLAELGRLDEAVPHYERALALQADNPEAHFNLGMVLARQGRREAAVRHWREALRLKPDYVEAQRQLRGVTERGPE